MNGWRVILQIDTPARQECHTFAEFPSLDPAHIAVLAETPSAGRVAGRLFDELLRSVSAVAQPSQCDGPRLLGCRGRQEPTCRSVLVAVADARPVSASFAQVMRGWMGPGPRDPVVVPVVPAGASPAAVFPSPLDKLIALFDTGAPETLGADVLRSARLGGADHRLFISYRRDDAQAVAEQLHDAFVHTGFQVFLDRFIGTPGRSFPRQLGEELADKAVVLVIESPQVWRSPWTLAEVAFADARNFGLFALQLPQAPRFAAIRKRFVAHKPGFWRTVGGGGGKELTDPGVDAVVTFVRRGYMQQALRRRVFLESKLRQALGAAPLTVTDGMYPTGGYVVHLASRPPQLNDVRRPVVVGQSILKHPVIVGPIRLSSPEMESDIRWLAGEMNLSLVDEANMTDMARGMRSGRKPL